VVHARLPAGASPDHTGSPAWSGADADRPDPIPGSRGTAAHDAARAARLGRRLAAARLAAAAAELAAAELTGAAGAAGSPPTSPAPRSAPPPTSPADRSSLAAELAGELGADIAAAIAAGVPLDLLEVMVAAWGGYNRRGRGG
jgi:hypothetical protein